jgi:RNA polymerase sigma-70 factor (ECF subfamily)
MRLQPKSDALSGESDETLVQAILSEGSEEAFRRLYRRHSPRLLLLLTRLLGSDSDAEDALQEAWLRATTRLQSFAWRSAFATWLTAIGVNVARDELDRRGRWIAVAIEEDVLVVGASELHEPIDLERAVAMLPPGGRAAFVLHDMEGFTHEEIALQLGYTVGTSKSQLFRARRTLRRLLNGIAVEETRNAGE